MNERRARRESPMRRWPAVLGLLAALLVTTLPAQVLAGDKHAPPVRRWSHPSGAWPGAKPGFREERGVFGATPDPWAHWPPRSRRGFDHPRDGRRFDRFGHARVTPREHLVWVPGFWSWTAHGWAWVPGHWAVTAP